MDQKQLLVEQQKLLYLRIDNALSRRQNINAVFISILSLTFTIEKSVLMSIFLIIISMIWINYLVYLKAINRATFKVIDEIEKKIGSELNQKECQAFEKVKSGSDYEQFIPKIFIIAFCINIVYQVFNCYPQ